MRTVGELNSYILGCLQNEEAGRVALYHYTKNFYEEDCPLTPEVINAFFAEALMLPHWQEKRTELFHDIQDLIQRFGAQNNFVFNLGSLWNLPRLQLVTAQNTEIIAAAVKAWEKKRIAENDELRLIADGEQRVICIRKHQDGYDVRAYGNLMRVEGCTLVPLQSEQELFYDTGLELKPHVAHRLRPSLHAQVRFVIGNRGLEARFVSGYAMRQSSAVTLESLHQDPRVFFPLKKLERFYIHRGTDPYYNDLITTLDRSIYLLRNQNPEGQDYARDSFERGQIAFDQIFPDDRALHARLSELVRLMPMA